MIRFFTSGKRTITHRGIMKTAMLYASALAAICSCVCTGDRLTDAFEGQRPAAPAAKRYTVSFNTDDGNPASITTVTVDSGSTLGARFPSNPARAGHTFDGWYDREEQYLANTAITKDVTLTAGWTAKRFIVSFNTAGGEPAYFDPVSVDSGKALGTDFPADPARDGYEFIVWFDGATGEEYTAQTAITKDAALTVWWEAVIPATKQFTVSFDAGSDAVTPAPVTVDSGGMMGRNFLVPARPGYEFDGWFDGGTQYTANTAIAKDVTLIAKWTIKRFSVSFNTGGGTPATISAVTVDSNSTLGTSFPANPTRVGYTFNGWFDGFTQYTSSTKITKDATVTAKWIPRYTVSFNANGGTPSNINPVTVDSGGTLGSSFPANPIKSNNLFGEWLDGTTQYTANTRIIKTVMLTAVWYKTVKIGTQTWMAENINVETSNSSCYDNNSANCAIYGRLYTWEAAMSVCPIGWHLPTEVEWNILVEYVGGSSGAGKKLKSTSGWDSRSIGKNGADDLGFSALPGGIRIGNNSSSIGESGYWWSATEDNSLAYIFTLYDFSDGASGYYNGKSIFNAVRCVSD